MKQFSFQTTQTTQAQIVTGLLLFQQMKEILFLSWCIITTMVLKMRHQQSLRLLMVKHCHRLRHTHFLDRYQQQTHLLCLVQQPLTFQVHSL